jgi:hypothetical protein
MGTRRRQVLGIYSDDAVLGWVGPIGLALAAGTALIIDVRPDSRSRSGTLADLMMDGPRLHDLSPGRRGVAHIASGAMESHDLNLAIETLAGRWPAVVVRSDGRLWQGPTVPYRPILPGLLKESHPSPSVWQPTSGAGIQSLPGPVLPRLGRRSVVAMLEGNLPAARRWVSAWHPIWDMPWA